MTGLMENLKSWARDIVFIMVFAGILELMLPSGSIRKYVRVVMGLVIVVVVLNPIISLMKGSLPQWELETYKPVAAEEVTPEVPRETEEAVMRVFARELEAEIEKAAEAMGASRASAQVEVGRDSQGKWDVTSVNLQVHGAFGWGVRPVAESDLRAWEDQAREALRTTLEERYGLRPEAISVTFIPD